MRVLLDTALLFAPQCSRQAGAAAGPAPGTPRRVRAGVRPSLPGLLEVLAGVSTDHSFIREQWTGAKRQMSVSPRRRCGEGRKARSVLPSSGFGDLAVGPWYVHPLSGDGKKPELVPPQTGTLVNSSPITHQQSGVAHHCCWYGRNRCEEVLYVVLQIRARRLHTWQMPCLLASPSGPPVVFKRRHLPTGGDP